MWSWVAVAFRRRRGTVAVVCGLQLSIPRSSTFVRCAATWQCADQTGAVCIHLDENAGRSTNTGLGPAVLLLARTGGDDVVVRS